jgi:hypothetical protein
LSTPARRKWSRWILVTAALAASQVYFLVLPDRAHPPTIVALEYIFLACAVIGLIGSIMMFLRRET